MSIESGEPTPFGSTPQGGPSEEKKAPEASQGAKQFTPEQREALEKAGYEVFQLTSQTHQEIIAAHPNIAFTRDFDRHGEGTGGDELMDHLESLRSRGTDVAVSTRQDVFLPKSNVSQEEQQRLVDEHSAETAGKIPGTREVLGNALDYEELGAQYADKHDGASLYGSWGNRRQATSTSGLYVSSMPKSESEPAEVRISSMRGGPNNEGPWVLPLVVPA